MTRPMFPYAERLKAEMLKVIEDPMRWPHTILPVKRRTDDGETIEFGIVKYRVCHSQDPQIQTVPTVYPSTLFSEEMRKHAPAQMRSQIDYADWDEFFADGWVVD